MKSRVKFVGLLLLYPACLCAESDLFVEKMFNAMPYKVYYWNKRINKVYSPNQSPFTIMTLKKRGHCLEPGEIQIISRSRIMTDDYVYFYYVPGLDGPSCRLSFVDVGFRTIKISDNNKPLANDLKDISMITRQLEEYSGLLGEYQYLKHNKYSHDILGTQLVTLSLLAGVFAIPLMDQEAGYSDFKKGCAIASAVGFCATALVYAHEKKVNSDREKRKDWIEFEIWRKLGELRTKSNENSSKTLFPVKSSNMIKPDLGE